MADLIVYSASHIRREPRVKLRSLGLINDLGLPPRIRDVGVDEALLPAIADNAIKNPWMLNNPRPVTSTDDAMEILRMAW